MLFHNLAPYITLRLQQILVARW